MTKAQRRQLKKNKEQAAVEAKDAQSTPKSQSKGPQTPPEETPKRPSLPPPYSNEHESAVTKQAADRPVPDYEREQSGEWEMDRVSRRKARQAMKDSPSIALTNNQFARKNILPQHQAAERINKKVPSKSMQRQAVKDSKVLPHTASDSVTAQRDPKTKQMTGTKPTKPHSSAVGQTHGIRSVVVPLVGNKAPLSELLKPFCPEDHKHKQLEKLQSGASPFTAYRSVRGMPSLLSWLPAISVACPLQQFAFPLCAAHMSSAMFYTTTTKTFLL